jgi:hypothetical protein
MRLCSVTRPFLNLQAHYRRFSRNKYIFESNISISDKNTANPTHISANRRVHRALSVPVPGVFDTYQPSQSKHNQYKKSYKFSIIQ